jgi:hypothetical protein
MARSHRLNFRSVLLRLGILLAATCALAELSCRTLVYAGWCSSWSVARSLRDPARFGRYKADDEYWEMKARFTPVEKLLDNQPFWDPVLGWTSGPVHPSDAAHDDESCLAGRRPILLFGDSYAFGVPLVTVGTFARWTEESELGQAWGLLNYGGGGYGLDQISLLLKRAVDRHLPRRPVVIVSFLVDDDIDRCMLSMRDWPKPRFELRDGHLALEQEQVPTLGEYLRAHSSLSPSRCFDLVRGAFLQNQWPNGSPQQDQHKREIARAIFADLVEFLRARDVPFFFVLFHHESSVADPSVTGWRDAFAMATLDELEAPWILVRPALLAHAARTGRSVSDYYIQLGQDGSGHFNVLGNHIAFQVLREGMRELLGMGYGGNLDAALGAQLDVASLPDGAQPPWLTSDAPPLTASGLQPPFAVFDPQGVERAVGSWRLVGEQRELCARASMIAQPRGAGVTGRVFVEVDGAPRAELIVHSGEPPLELVVDLRGARTFWIRTKLEPCDAALARVVLDRFRVLPDEGLPRVAPALR